MIREAIYNIIDGERDYQDDKFPNEKHSVGEYLSLLRYHLLQADAAFNESGEVETLDEIRKLAALCVACMEENSAVPRRNYETGRYGSRNPK